MIVVADTSPLNYPALIGAVDVLQPLYTLILVPKTVADELRDASAPEAVRNWISHPPPWLQVRPDPPADAGLQHLDPGERAALALAELLQAGVILIDERDGRKAAHRRRLKVTGTLGVLGDAHLAGLLDFDQSLTRLRATNFRLSSEVEGLVRRRILVEKKRT